MGAGCIGTPAMPSTGGGGMGGFNGMGNAMNAFSMGMTFFSMLESMQESTAASAPAATAPATHPANLGGYTTYSPAWNPPADNFVTDQQRTSLLDQLRPIGSDAGGADLISADRSALLGDLRPIGADMGNAQAISGAGVSVPANPVEAEKSALLGGMRPIGGASSGAQPSGTGQSDQTAANQLCAAANQPTNCIPRLTLHPMGTNGPVGPSGAVGPSGSTMATPAAAGVGALGAGLASAGGNGGAAVPCTQIVGYSVTSGPMGDNQVDVQTGPCGSGVQVADASASGAGAGESDEALSANARVPFDTAGGSQGSAAPVALPSDNTAPTVLRSPTQVAFVTRDTIDAERKALKARSCKSIAELHHEIAALGTALRRMNALMAETGPERAEWLAEVGKTSNEAWWHLYGATVGLFDVHNAHQLDSIDREIEEVMNKRINALNDQAERDEIRAALQKLANDEGQAAEIERSVAASTDVRQQDDIVLGALEKQKEKLKLLSEKWVKPADLVDKIHGDWEIANSETVSEAFWSTAKLALDVGLGNRAVQKALKIGSGYGEFETALSSLVDAGTDLGSQLLNMHELAELDRQSAAYSEAMKKLREKMDDAVKQLKAAEARAKNVSPLTRVCATAA
ncbi:MAG TPA: hypothetical protein VMF53_03245 [Alphaproteobacteria bacterium]|nr:hypothetical protein [Alphaproteobacteria bacterium]